MIYKGLSYAPVDLLLFTLNGKINQSKKVLFSFCTATIKLNARILGNFKNVVQLHNKDGGNLQLFIRLCEFFIK